jgi:hypothetical protein
MQHESRFRKVHDFEERTIINCLGYKDMTTDGTIYYVIPSLFKDEICRGMGESVKTVRGILKKANILQTEYTNDRERDKRTIIDGKRRMFTTLVVKSDLSNSSDG